MTGAFLFALMFWVIVFELWLAYTMVWAMVEGVRWVAASVLVGPLEAARSRRDDKEHKARLVSEGDDW